MSGSGSAFARCMWTAQGRGQGRALSPERCPGLSSEHPLCGHAAPGIGTDAVAYTIRSARLKAEENLQRDASIANRDRRTSPSWYCGFELCRPLVWCLLSEPPSSIVLNRVRPFGFAVRGYLTIMLVNPALYIFSNSLGRSITLARRAAVFLVAIIISATS